MNKIIYNIIFIGAALLFIFSFVMILLPEGKAYKEQDLNQQYMQACFSNHGIIIDNVCVDPIKFEQAKIHLQIGS